MRLDELRSHPEKNPKVSAISALERYEGRDDIFISFRDIEKLGINPGSTYDTPIGIYAYPLSAVLGGRTAEDFESPESIFAKTMNHHVPFAGDKPFIHVFSVKSREGIVWDMKAYSDADLDADIVKLRKLVETVDVKAETDRPTHIVTPSGRMTIAQAIDAYLGGSPVYKRLLAKFSAHAIEPLLDEMRKAHPGLAFSPSGDPDGTRTAMLARFEEFVEASSAPSSAWADSQVSRTPFGRFWFLALATARMIAADRGQKAPVLWNAILRRLGYRGFVDIHGEGIIHPNEPIQALFLTRDVLKPIDIVENKMRTSAAAILAEVKGRVAAWLQKIQRQITTPAIDRVIRNAFPQGDYAWAGKSDSDLIGWSEWDQMVARARAAVVADIHWEAMNFLVDEIRKGLTDKGAKLSAIETDGRDAYEVIAGIVETQIRNWTDRNQSSRVRLDRAIRDSLGRIQAEIGESFQQVSAVLVEKIVNRPRDLKTYLTNRIRDVKSLKEAALKAAAEIKAHEAGESMLATFLRYGSGDHAAHQVDSLVHLAGLSWNDDLRIERHFPLTRVLESMESYLRFGPNFLTYLTGALKEVEPIGEEVRAVLAILPTADAGARDYGYDKSDPTSLDEDYFEAMALRQALAAFGQVIAKAGPLFAEMKEKFAEVERLRVHGDRYRPEHDHIETLYHATAFATEIARDGFLDKAPNDRRGLGNYGDVTDVISFTHDYKIAQDLMRALKDLWMIAHGQLTAREINSWIHHEKIPQEFPNLTSMVGVSEPTGEKDILGHEKRRLKDLHEITGPVETAKLYTVYLATSPIRTNPVFAYVEETVKVLMNRRLEDIGILACEVEIKPENDYLMGEKEFRLPSSQVVSVRRIV